MTTLDEWRDVHMGRSFNGHRLEDACPCPKEPCGLVAFATARDDCPQHSYTETRTMRQMHASADCPAVLAEPPC